MQKMITLLSAALLLATVAWAQEPEPARPDTGQPRLENEVSRVNEILKIIGLPGVAEQARDAGLPEEDIRTIFDEAEKRKLPPAETEILLRESGTAVAESGPVDNFGAFVQSKLDEGLRGRELADAIHAEHRLHGKGHAKGHGKRDGHGQNKGKGRGIDRDRDDGHDRDTDDKDETGNRGKNKKGHGK